MGLGEIRISPQAVGSKDLLKEKKEKMGPRARGRQTRESEDKYSLREPINSALI